MRARRPPPGTPAVQRGRAGFTHREPRRTRVSRKGSRERGGGRRPGNWHQHQDRGLPPQE
eukprot:448350-Pyramimonas_sp.AAC.1